MKFAAIALIGVVAADGTKTKVETQGCIKGIGYYTDKECKKASTNAAVKTAAAAATKVVAKLCTDGKTMTKNTAYPLDKCTKLGAKVGDAEYIMYHSKAAGAKYIAAGVSAVLAFAATQF